MLTKGVRNFLTKIPVSQKVTVKPFGPKAKRTGDRLVAAIKEKFPELNVLFMGATALEIAGQNDIDIYVVAKPSEFDEYLPWLEKKFGKPKHTHTTFTEWNFKKAGFPVELYLTELPEKHVQIFEILKSNKELLREYENLKLKFNGKSFRDYQKAKYGFYNKILNERH